MLAKPKLNTKEVLISKAFIDSYKFDLVNIKFRRYDDMKQKSKNLKISTVHQKF